MKHEKKAKVIKITKVSPLEKKIIGPNTASCRDTQVAMSLISDILADQIKMLKEIELSIEASRGQTKHKD